MTEPSPSHAAAVRDFRRRQDLEEARQRVEALAEVRRVERAEAALAHARQVAEQEAAAVPRPWPSVQDRVHANPGYLNHF